jgi:hypothetical protein
MSALPKPEFDFDYAEIAAQPQRVSPKVAPGRERRSQSSQAQPTATVQPLVTPEAPAGLNLILRLQRASTPLAWICVALAIPFYGLTVTTQRSWGQQYKELQHLQRQEQQLAAAQAVNRSQVAERSLQNQRLIPQVPANSLFLRTAPARTVAVPPAATQPSSLPGQPTPSSAAPRPVSY